MRKYSIGRCSIRPLTGWVAMLVAGGLCGCGSGDTAMTVSGFCMEKAARECGAAGSGGVADKCVVDVNRECKPARMAMCTEWTSAIQQSSGSARPFTPARANECLDKTSEVYKKSTIVPADVDALKSVCDHVFSGSKKRGDACSSDMECGDALICDLVCAMKVNLLKGDFCGGIPGAVCGPGLYCANPAGQPLKMCLDRPTNGQACDDATAPCLETLRCLADTSTCGARLGISQNCTSNADCDATAPYCDPYLGGRCDTGFIPSPGTPECTTFGAPTP